MDYKAMSRGEIALYLYEFCNTFYNWVNNDISFIDAKADNDIDLSLMIKTFTMLFGLRQFSIGKDYLFNSDYYKGRKMDCDEPRRKMNEELNKCFDEITSCDEHLKGKIVVDNLRHCFCHDNPENETFELAKDGESFKIKFNWSDGSKEEHIADIEELKIVLEVIKNYTAHKFSYRYTPDYFGNIGDYDLNNIDDIKLDINFSDNLFYSNPELDTLIKETLNRKIATVDEKKQKVGDYRGLNDPISDEYLDMNLDDDGQECFKDLWNIYKSDDKLPPNADAANLRYYALDASFPHPFLKAKKMNRLATLIYNICYNLDFTYNQVLSDFQINQIPSIDYTEQWNLVRDMCSPVSLVRELVMIFIEYIVVHIYDYGLIVINDQKYETERIRNSLEHGRWIINKYDVCFYDNKDKRKRNRELELVGKINIDDLYNWAINEMDRRLFDEQFDQELARKNKNR